MERGTQETWLCSAGGAGSQDGAGAQERRLKVEEIQDYGYSNIRDTA